MSLLTRKEQTKAVTPAARELARQAAQQLELISTMLPSRPRRWEDG